MSDYVKGYHRDICPTGQRLGLSRRGLLVHVGAASLTSVATRASALTGPPIVRLATGVTVFVGHSNSGPVGAVVTCSNFSDFTSAFGLGDGVSELAPSVNLFFENGGVKAYVVNLPSANPEASDYAAAYQAIDLGVGHFDLLVMPACGGDNPNIRSSLWAPASAFCQRRNALLLIDPPANWRGANDVAGAVTSLRAGMAAQNAALSYPRIQVIDPAIVQAGGAQTRMVGPAGALAGLLAREDASSGVWKSGAGPAYPLRGEYGIERATLAVDVSTLNAQGVNVIRQLPAGVVQWGARTLAGFDGGDYQFRYIQVERLTLHIRESIGHGLAWVAHQPHLNPHVRGPVSIPLFVEIEQQVRSFMNGLYISGAFAGATPTLAYNVRCDSLNNSDADVAMGVVNLDVAFAPLIPAEFINLRLQQKTS